MKYSATTGGFYTEKIHGKKIPGDAVEVSLEEYAALFNAQAAGKRIVSDHEGNPVSIDPPALSGDAVVLAQITALEASISVRRIREAIVGTDGGWLVTLNSQIVDLRKHLK